MTVQTANGIRAKLVAPSLSTRTISAPGSHNPTTSVACGTTSLKPPTVQKVQHTIPPACFNNSRNPAGLSTALVLWPIASPSVASRFGSKSCYTIYAHCKIRMMTLKVFEAAAAGTAAQTLLEMPAHVLPPGMTTVYANARAPGTSTASSRSMAMAGSAAMQPSARQDHAKADAAAMLTAKRLGALHATSRATACNAALASCVKGLFASTSARARLGAPTAIVVCATLAMATTTSRPMAPGSASQSRA